MPSSGLVTAPTPVTGNSYQLGTNWIEHDVTGQLQEVALLLNKDCFEAALHEMTGAGMLPVEPLCIYPVEMLHSPRQVWFRRFDKKVIMIGHQAVRVAYPPESLDSNTKYFEEPSAIDIVEKDIFPCVSPTGNVIYSAFVFNPQWTSHDVKSIAHRTLKGKI